MTHKCSRHGFQGIQRQIAVAFQQSGRYKIIQAEEQLNVYNTPQDKSSPANVKGMQDNTMTKEFIVVMRKQ